MPQLTLVASVELPIVEDEADDDVAPLLEQIMEEVRLLAGDEIGAFERAVADIGRRICAKTLCRGPFDSQVIAYNASEEEQQSANLFRTAVLLPIRRSRQLGESGWYEILGKLFIERIAPQILQSLVTPLPRCS